MAKQVAVKYMPKCSIRHVVNLTRCPISGVMDIAKNNPGHNDWCHDVRDSLFYWYTSLKNKNTAEEDATLERQNKDW